jgi:hypothetical protein
MKQQNEVFCAMIIPSKSPRSKAAKELIFKRYLSSMSTTCRFLSKKKIKNGKLPLLYIDMTRAKEYLCLSYSGESEFTEYFERIREERGREKGTRKKLV